MDRKYPDGGHVWVAALNPGTKTVEAYPAVIINALFDEVGSELEYFGFSPKNGVLLMGAPASTVFQTQAEAEFFAAEANAALAQKGGTA